MNALLKSLPLNPQYLVSSYGEVYSLKSGKHRQLKTPVDNLGYPRVDIWFSGGTRINRARKTCRVHNLVWLTFVGFTEEDKEKNYVVNHIDGNKLNCSLDNLEVVSRSYNTWHAWHHNLIVR